MLEVNHRPILYLLNLLFITLCKKLKGFYIFHYQAYCKKVPRGKSADHQSLLLRA